MSRLQKPFLFCVEFGLNVCNLYYFIRVMDRTSQAYKLISWKLSRIVSYVLMLLHFVAYNITWWTLEKMELWCTDSTHHQAAALNLIMNLGNMARHICVYTCMSRLAGLVVSDIVCSFRIKPSYMTCAMIQFYAYCYRNKGARGSVVGWGTVL
jgi:hypothetical protein